MLAVETGLIIDSFISSSHGEITYIQGTLFYNMNTNEKQLNDKTFNSYKYDSVIRIKIII